MLLCIRALKSGLFKDMHEFRIEEQTTEDLAEPIHARELGSHQWIF